MYARLINGEWREVVGNTAFSDTVYQTPESLTDAQRSAFGLYLIVEMPRPDLLPTQKLGDPIYQISGTTVERTYPSVSKTPDELARDAEALQESIVAQTQQRLDAFARTRSYDGIQSACTYATSTVPRFQAEGQYCVEARDATWAKLYEMLAEVRAGTRPVPSGYSDIEPELPVMSWPDQ